jgi:hypothetical protein
VGGAAVALRPLQQVTGYAGLHAPMRTKRSPFLRPRLKYLNLPGFRSDDRHIFSSVYWVNGSAVS